MALPATTTATATVSPTSNSKHSSASGSMPPPTRWQLATTQRRSCATRALEFSRRLVSLSSENIRDPEAVAVAQHGRERSRRTPLCHGSRKLSHCCGLCERTLQGRFLGFQLALHSSPPEVSPFFLTVRRSPAQPGRKHGPRISAASGARWLSTTPAITRRHPGDYFLWRPLVGTRRALVGGRRRRPVTPKR